jgi:hypothetical protein
MSRRIGLVSWTGKRTLGWIRFGGSAARFGPGLHWGKGISTPADREARQVAPCVYVSPYSYRRVAVRLAGWHLALMSGDRIAEITVDQVRDFIAVEQEFEA